MKSILKTLLVPFAAVSMVAAAPPADDSSVSINYSNNRYPLLQKDYIKLPLGAIKADGWMQDQLIRMKNGFTGHLDQIYEKVMGPRNGWLGGDGDVWERGPYWIDGLLPLAYLLDDEALKEKAETIINEFKDKTDGLNEKCETQKALFEKYDAGYYVRGRNSK